VYLQANSTVFADMLAVGNDVPVGSGVQDLPVVDVSEESPEPFLLHLIPSRFLDNDRPPIPTTSHFTYPLLDAIFAASTGTDAIHSSSLTTRLHLPVYAEEGAMSAWDLSL